MKRISYTLSVLFLLVGLTGCANNDTAVKTQISPGTNNQVVELSQYDIDLKYCLLNPEGEPATVFSEGENFTIFFSLTNTRGNQVHIDNTFPPREIGRIYSLDGTDMGEADGLALVPKDEKAFFVIPADSTRYFAMSWMNDSLPRQKALPRGGYYATFDYSFDLTQPESENASYKKAVTDKLRFKIYFTVR